MCKPTEMRVCVSRLMMPAVYGGYIRYIKCSKFLAELIWEAQ